MGEPEPIEGVMRKIQRKWENDKEGWSVLGNVDKDGNREMLISQSPNSYWLKMRTINAYSQMALGKELKSIDDEISKEIQGSTNVALPINSQEDLMHIFGMMVPSHKDVIYTAGVERFSPKIMNDQKSKVEQKEPEADKLFRLYLRKKWEREQELRENMYL